MRDKMLRQFGLMACTAAAVAIAGLAAVAAPDDQKSKGNAPDPQSVSNRVDAAPAVSPKELRREAAAARLAQPAPTFSVIEYKELWATLEEISGADQLNKAHYALADEIANAMATAKGESPELNALQAKLNTLMTDLANPVVQPKGGQGGVAGLSPNETCGTAITVAVPSMTAGDTVLSDNDFATTCGTSNTAPDVWYMVAGTGTSLRARLCGASYDSKISVFSGSCASLTCVVGEDDDFTNCVGNTDDPDVSWCASGGVDYFIVVHGFSGGTGTFTLDLSGGAACGPPPNDTCATAEAIGPPPDSDTEVNTFGVDDTTPFCGVSTPNQAIWYTVTGTGNTMTATTCNAPSTNYDTTMQVLCGTCATPICIGGNDDTVGGGASCETTGVPGTIRGSTVTWCSEMGSTYYILVGGFSSATGTSQLDVSDNGMPCVGAIGCALGVCGDGTVNVGEECDDGNLINNDGCSALCVLEGGCCKADGTCLANLLETDCIASGGVYQGDASDCMMITCPVCGNGVVEGAEGCDDGNTMNGDGCSSSCVCEPIVGTPANNDCANRIPITDGNYCFDLTSATTDGIVEAVCNFAVGDDNVHNDIWYNYTATCTGVLVIDTCSAGSFDTRLAVYSGFACPPAGAPIDCDDDDDDNTNLCGGSLESVLAIPVTMGDMLKIRVGEFSATSGSGADLLNVQCQMPMCGNGTVEIGEQCDDGNVMGGDGCSSGCQLEGACCLPNGMCVDNLLEADCVAQPGVYQGDASDCTIDMIVCPVCGNGTVEAGEECDDGNTMNGDGCSSTCQDEPAPNDECINRIDAFDGPNPFTVVGATLDVGAPIPCQASMTNDVWFNYMATCNGFATIETCDLAGTDTTLQVYNGCNCAALVDFVPTACSDDDCGGPPAFSSTVDVPVVMGNCYKIRLGGFFGGEPTGTLTISCTMPVCGNMVVEAGEECDDGNVMAGDGCDAACQNEGACCVGMSCQQLSDTACASAMGAYDGDGVACGAQCSFGSCCFADGACLETSFKCCADQMGMFNGGADCSPNMCPQPPLTNDNCADRDPIGDGVTAFSTLGATTDGSAHLTCMFDGQTYEDIWYNYTATCTGTLTVSTCNTVDYDSDIVLYDGWDCLGLEDPPLSCNDDGAGCAGFSSLATASVTMGQQIKIRIGGFAAGDEGTGTVAITCGGGGGGCDVMCDVGKTPEGEPDCGLPTDTVNGGCNGVGMGGGTSTCCSAQVTPGCDDLTCETAVCACDSFCCMVEWDASCAGTGFVPGCGAAILCPALCPAGTFPFGSVACGESICGTAAFDGSLRDTDWYEIVVASEMQLTWTVTAEFDSLIGIVDTGGVPDCNLAMAIDPFALAGPCVEASVSACLPPGTYWFFVAPQFTANVACGAEYNAALTCGSCPTGACCSPAPMCSCSQTTEADCAAMGGVFKGLGTPCVAGPGGTCDCNANGICDQSDLLPSGGVVKSEVYDVDPNAAIIDCVPPADPVTTDTRVFASGCGPIVDLDVDLQITHTWVGDLVVELTHVDSGTTVRLMQRIGDGGTNDAAPLCSGGTPGGFGNSNDNLDVILDDEAAASIEAQIGLVNTGGRFQSSPGLLSAFDMLEKCATWTISVHDGAGGDLGTLNGWSLHFVNVPQMPPVSVDCNNNDTPDECELMGNDCNSNMIPDDCELAGNDNIPPGGDGILDACNCVNDVDCGPGEACDVCNFTCMPAGFPCVTNSDCKNDPANNACNCSTCPAGFCVYTCSKFGNVNCDAMNLVNLDDILCVLSGFSLFANCSNGDISPCGGNGIINLDDILAVLNAFGGGNPCNCQQAGSPPLCGSISP